MTQAFKQSRACLEQKIPHLLASGYPREQAIAIAFSECEGKSWDDLSDDQKAVVLGWFPAKRCANCTQIKALGNGRVGGYGVVWGDGEHRDLEGDYFTPQTDFSLTGLPVLRFGQKATISVPWLYDHALQDIPEAWKVTGTAMDYKVGVVDTILMDDIGLWIEAQVDAHKQWAEIVLDLIDRGMLHWSSGSVPHLVKAASDGWLKGWPIVEWSSTPTPAEPRQTDLLRLKHYAGSSQEARPTPIGAPDKGARGLPGADPVQSPDTLSSNGESSMQTALEIKTAQVHALYADSIGAAVKEGNAIEDAARPAAELLAELAGIDVEQALQLVIDIVASHAGGGGEEAPAEAPADGGAMMSADDLDALVDAKVSKALEVERKANGGYLTKNIQVMKRALKPMGLGQYIKAVRDHDHAALAAQRPLIRQGYKAMGINPDTTGGYVVPVEQSMEIIELLRETARVVPLCMPWPMASDTVTVPKVTGHSTVRWLGENAQILDSIPEVGQVMLQAKKAACFVKVGNELIDDSSPDAEALVRQLIADDLAEEWDRVILEGSGVGSEPMGMANHPDTTKTALNATPTYAILMACLQRLRQANVKKDGWTWVFNPAILPALSQLDDDRGGYIWTEMGSNQAMVGGYPATLLGYPWLDTTLITIDTANNDETRLYMGQWKDILVGTRKVIEIMASDVAGTAFEYDQTWIRAIMRVDVNIRHAESIDILTDVRSA